MARRSRKRNKEHEYTRSDQRRYSINSNMDNVLNRDRVFFRGDRYRDVDRVNKIRLRDRIISAHYRMMRLRGLLQNPVRYKFKAYKERTGLANIDPDRIRICSKRKLRRRVLFMIRGVGKGSRNRNRNFTEESKVRC